MTPTDNFRNIRDLDKRVKKIEAALRHFCSDIIEKAEAEVSQAALDRDRALTMLRSKCKWCAKGEPPIDGKSLLPTDYHYYSYNPCALTEEERELVWTHLRDK